MRNKYTKYLITIIAIFLASVAPISVSAISMAQQAYDDNNYDNLADAFTWLEITRKCLENEVDDWEAVKNNVADKSDYFFDITKYALGLTLDFFYNVDYSGTGSSGGSRSSVRIWNNKLDWAAKDAKDQKINAFIWCRELKTDVKTNPIKVLNSWKEKFGSKYDQPVGDIICGKDDDNTGFLMLTLKKDGDIVKNLDPKKEGLPDWMATDENGHFKSCKAARQQLLNEVYRDEYFKGRDYTFAFSENKNFHFEDYYADVVGVGGDAEHKPFTITDKSISYSIEKTILDNLQRALVYQNLIVGDYCEVSNIATEAEYNKQKENSDNVFKFYYNGQYRYLKIGKLNSEEKIIYPYTGTIGSRSSDNRDENEGLTCRAAIEFLTEYSDSQLQEDLISRCHATARSNNEKINSLITKLEVYTQKATRSKSKALVDAANYMITNDTTGDLDETDANALNIVARSYGSSINEMIKNDWQLSKSSFMIEFGDLAKELSDLIFEYSDNPGPNGKLTSDQSVTLSDKLKDFKNKLSGLDDLIEQIKEIRIENSALNKNFSDLNSYERDYGLYEINEETGEFTCILNDRVIEGMNKITEETGFPFEPDEYVQFKEQEPLDGSHSNSSGDECYNTGIEGMSWILCPVINNSRATVDLFEKTLRTMLSINSDELFGKNDQAYRSWEVFRNIANVIITIIFLFIIFSQLTGYGIDNYGIKKMLPKLIVMAILINLSYIICEILVDLSNILGVGLNNLFEFIAGVDSSEEETQTIITVVFGGILAAAVAAASGAAGGGIGIMLALLLALVSAIVALLIFLAMVGIRMIIVIAFTVISPVAFALYILPNTQNLFKKWWKVFEAALVVFPICGALYGIHFIIRGILKTSGSNTFMQIAMIIAPFLPFFALPSLLKGAMAGLGSVAGAITAAGSSLRKGANRGVGAIKGSEKYKNMQQNLQEKKAQNTYDKLKDKLSKGENLTASERRRYLRTGAITQKVQKDAEGIYKGNFDTQNRSEVAAALNKSLLGNDAQKAGAAFDSLLAQGGTDEALKALEGANWGSMNSEVRDRLLRGMSGSNVDAMKAFAKYRGSGGTAGFKNWANNTRTTEEQAADAAAKAKVQSYAQHLKENGEHAMDGYSKDEAQFVSDHMSGIQSGMDGTFKKDFGAMLGSAGLNSKDAKAQTVWDGLVAKELRESNLEAGNLGITADSIGVMREGMSNSIKEGIKYEIAAKEGSLQVDDKVNKAIEEAFSDQIKAVQSSSLIKDRAKAGVLKDFGIKP